MRSDRRRPRRDTTTLAALSLIVHAAAHSAAAQHYATPPHATPDTLTFNQDHLLRVRPELAPIATNAATNSTDAGAPRLRFDDPPAILIYILANVDHGWVLPTERYFYYAFDLGHRRVSGNIRFTEIDDGVVHLGYFDVYDQRNVRMQSFTNGDAGVLVEPIETEAPEFDAIDGADPSTRSYRVAVGGESAVFSITDLHTTAGRSVPLRDGERRIAGVLDESGYPLVLLFDEDARRFRFVINDEFDTPERLDPIDDAGTLSVGRTSRFVFFTDDLRRRVLVGVWGDHIARNTIYDGPFDQVPPRLDIRDSLHAAYPYTRDNAPIDAHGRFLGRPGFRVAIAPYRPYDTLDQLAAWVQSLEREHADDPHALLAALNHERQSDFAPPRLAGYETRSLPAREQPYTLGEIIRTSPKRE